MAKVFAVYVLSSRKFLYRRNVTIKVDNIHFTTVNDTYSNLHFCYIKVIRKHKQDLSASPERCDMSIASDKHRQSFTNIIFGIEPTDTCTVSDICNTVIGRIVD